MYIILLLTVEQRSYKEIQFAKDEQKKKQFCNINELYFMVRIDI